jgi:hypothetical protein
MVVCFPVDQDTVEDGWDWVPELDQKSSVAQLVFIIPSPTGWETVAWVTLYYDYDFHSELFNIAMYS